jgi:hypothetical protein
MEEWLMRTAVSSLTWCCILGMLAPPVLAAEEPTQKPGPFACEIRYHFRENIRGAKAGEKRVSAPSHEREALPLSRPTISKDATAQSIEGKVPHLPYRFLVKIVRLTDAGRETLEVNVLDNSGHSLTGFPQVMPNPLTRTGDSSRKEFEIPVSEPLKKKIEKTLLARDQFITHVDLIVGIDDDFLSSASTK